MRRFYSEWQTSLKNWKFYFADMFFLWIFQIIWKSESRSQRKWKHQQRIAVGEWWLLFWQRNNLCLTANDEIKSRCTEKWAKNRTQEKSAGLHLMLIVHDWGGSGESVNFLTQNAQSAVSIWCSDILFKVWTDISKGEFWTKNARSADRFNSTSVI